jgi:hypothetical protein
MAFVVGCGEGDRASGEGAVRIRVSGEDAAKRGYPFVKNGAEIAFVDGWTMRFRKYLVAFGNVRLRGEDGRVAFEAPETFVADLRRGDPALPAFTGIAARRWERFGFEIAPPIERATPLGELDEGDVAEMVGSRINYLIDGEAEKNGRRVTFRWGLRNPTRNSNCTDGIDGKDGIVVRASATTDTEITVHVDHLFWSSLGSERAELRFDAVAAVADVDGVIAWESLAKQTIADLRDERGAPLLDARSGRRVFYDPGSVPLEAPTLQAFMLASAAAQGHVNGTGLCTVSAR